MPVLDRPRPVGGVDYPRTQQELQAWFPDDGAALTYLARLRWPDGFSCPSCSSTRCWQTAKAKWMCAACSRQTSATAGTIFHRMRTPLTMWFSAIWLITSQQTGASALDLQRLLGFSSDETAWTWLQKVRRAMVRPDRDVLSGVVEIDEVLVEVFIGSESRGEADADTDSSTVLIAVESMPDRTLGRVRLSLAADARTSNLVGFAMRVVREGATIKSHRATNSRRLSGLGYQIEPVLALDDADSAKVNLPGAQLVGSLLAGWLRQTLQGPVSRDHLEYYLDEYTFRFNNRSSTGPGLLFYRLLQQAANNGADTWWSPRGSPIPGRPWARKPSGELTEVTLVGPGGVRAHGAEPAGTPSAAMPPPGVDRTERTSMLEAMTVSVPGTSDIPGG